MYNNAAVGPVHRHFPVSSAMATVDVTCSACNFDYNIGSTYKFTSVELVRGILADAT